MIFTKKAEAYGSTRKRAGFQHLAAPTRSRTGSLRFLRPTGQTAMAVYTHEHKSKHNNPTGECSRNMVRRLRTRRGRRTGVDNCSIACRVGCFGALPSQGPNRRLRVPDSIISTKSAIHIFRIKIEKRINLPKPFVQPIGYSKISGISQIHLERIRAGHLSLGIGIRQRVAVGKLDKTCT